MFNQYCIPQLYMKSRLIVNNDTEYQSNENIRSKGLTVQMVLESSEGYEKETIYLHPESLSHVSDLVKKRLKSFRHAFAVFDAMGLDESQVRFRHYQEIVTDKSNKNGKMPVFTIRIYIFWSMKDIQFLFRNVTDYVRYILPMLDRGRRIHKVHNGADKSPYIKLPWQILVPTRWKKKGEYHYSSEPVWHSVSIEICDISAMQGMGSLDKYASRVGLRLPNKANYSKVQKGDMFGRINENTDYYCDYSIGDVSLKGAELVNEKGEVIVTLDEGGVLSRIFTETNIMYTKIARLIGICEDKQEIEWGFSTGAIVAQMLSRWIAKQINIDVKDLHKLTEFAGSEGFVKYAAMFKSKPNIKNSLLYLSMVDGGRAVRERIKDFKRRSLDCIHGLLNDIDIGGCYANGLKNQKFAIGHPHIDGERMTLREFLAKYEHELIPGLWYARVSWRNAPFKQDVLLSKVPKNFNDEDEWEFDEEAKQFMGEVSTKETSMFLSTRNVYHAALNHDLLQILQSTSSKRVTKRKFSEWEWLLDNCMVDSVAIYRKSDRVATVTTSMLEGIKQGTTGLSRIEFSREWVEVDLAPLLKTLVAERAKTEKKSPMNEFLKLICNTVYGCIASPYFSTPGTGISNVVVGNNITARARALAWCMAKGLGTFIIVTDGGVFDVNRVFSYKSISLDKFASVSEGINTDDNRNYFVSEVPLFGHQLTEDELAAMWTKNDKREWVNPELDKRAWNHLAAIFPDLDIFTQQQFYFESKYGSGMGEDRPYTKLVLHNKVDYLLSGSKGDEAAVLAIRGFHRVEGEDGKPIHDPEVLRLFKAVEENKPICIDSTERHILSLKEWEERYNPHDWVEQYENGSGEELLLPHDNITRPKRTFSHTPLSKRYETLEDYLETLKKYDKAREFKPAKGRHPYGMKPRPNLSELQNMTSEIASISR